MKNTFFSITTMCAVLGFSAGTLISDVSEANDWRPTVPYQQNYSAYYPGSSYNNASGNSLFLPVGNSYSNYPNGNCPNGLCGTQSGYSSGNSSCPDGKCGLRKNKASCPNGQCGNRNNLQSTPRLPVQPDYEVPRLFPSQPSYDDNRNLDARYNSSNYSGNEVFNAFQELEGVSRLPDYSRNRVDDSSIRNRRRNDSNRNRDISRYDRSSRDRDISRSNREDYRINPAQYQTDSRNDDPVSYQTPVNPPSNEGRSPYYE